jgi:hypothetical protein
MGLIAAMIVAAAAIAIHTSLPYPHVQIAHPDIPEVAEPTTTTISDTT